MITIVDYGMGNLGSIQNMLKRVGARSRVAASPEEIVDAGKILLPGVGAFDNAMQRINDSGLREALDRKALKEKVPVLGICLGMQLLTRSSEEGTLPGLGWIEASAHRFPASAEFKVPHMGWNVATPAQAHPLLAGLPEESRFYFVHSYYVTADRPENSLLKTTYGHVFDSGLVRDNICGAQFHPEKSHRFGLQLLKNFAEL